MCVCDCPVLHFYWRLAPSSVIRMLALTRAAPGERVQTAPLAMVLPKAAGSVYLHGPSKTQRLPITDRHEHAQLDRRRITSLNLRQED